MCEFNESMEGQELITCDYCNEEFIGYYFIINITEDNNQPREIIERHTRTISELVHRNDLHVQIKYNIAHNEYNITKDDR